MTISNFDHVNSELIRNLCNGEAPAHSGYLAYAIGYIAKMAELDAQDSEISYAIVNKRMAYANCATSAFDNGNYSDCLEAIRAFWTN